MTEFQIPYSSFTIKRLSKSIKNGNLLPSSLACFCLERIKKLNRTLNSFITILPDEEIFDKAERCDMEIKNGNYLGPLHGIPFSVKDIIHVQNIKFTAGSKIYTDYISHTTASCVEILNKAGAIFVGTNNLNEFASGINGKNPTYGNSKNPWDLSRISGGSSGGSAVAVSTGMVVFSLGTDTGGSIRVPSSLCGVVGLKPSFNLINTHGVFPLSPSLDHVGCITRSVDDSIIVFNYIINHQRLRKIKKTSIKGNYRIYGKLTDNSKIVIGIPLNYFLDVLDDRIKKLFFDLLKHFSNENFIIHNFSLDHTKSYFSSWRTIRLSESAVVHLRRLKTDKDRFSEEVRKMLIDGTKIHSTDYIRALNRKRKIKNEFISLFKRGIDIIIIPTTITPAPKLRETIIDFEKIHLNVRETLLRNTAVFNSIGLPALTIPMGLVKEDENFLPVGLQIIGPLYRDDLVLSMGKRLENIIGIKNLVNPSHLSSFK